jgi:hypothetical protein
MDAFETFVPPAEKPEHLGREDLGLGRLSDVAGREQGISSFDQIERLSRLERCAARANRE